MFRRASLGFESERGDKAASSREAEPGEQPGPMRRHPELRAERTGPGIEATVGADVQSAGYPEIVFTRRHRCVCLLFLVAHPGEVVIEQTGYELVAENCLDG